MANKYTEETTDIRTWIYSDFHCDLFSKHFHWKQHTPVKWQLQDRIVHFWQQEACLAPLPESRPVESKACFCVYRQRWGKQLCQGQLEEQASLANKLCSHGMALKRHVLPFTVSTPPIALIEGTENGSEVTLNKNDHCYRLTLKTYVTLSRKKYSFSRVQGPYKENPILWYNKIIV